MKFRAIFAMALLASSAMAQPRNAPPENVSGPSVRLNILPGIFPGHPLPPGAALPHEPHKSWMAGQVFSLDGFHGPGITHPGDYDLPPPRSGTHWLYADGAFLMVGNRTGRIFAEIPADY